MLINIHKNIYTAVYTEEFSLKFRRASYTHFETGYGLGAASRFPKCLNKKKIPSSESIIARLTIAPIFGCVAFYILQFAKGLQDMALGLCYMCDVIFVLIGCLGAKSMRHAGKEEKNGHGFGP